MYAKLLGERIAQHDTNVYLVNTGWSGGPYGVGQRMKLAYTRAMIHAALDGDLGKDGWTTMPLFNVAIPKSCPNVPSDILNPRNTWADKDAYDDMAKKLAGLFNDNFKKLFEGKVTEDIASAGPKL